MYGKTDVNEMHEPNAEHGAASLLSSSEHMVGAVGVRCTVAGNRRSAPYYVD